MLLHNCICHLFQVKTDKQLCYVSHKDLQAALRASSCFFRSSRSSSSSSASPDPIAIAFSYSSASGSSRVSPSGNAPIQTHNRSLEEEDLHLIHFHINITESPELTIPELDEAFVVSFSFSSSTTLVIRHENAHQVSSCN